MQIHELTRKPLKEAGVLGAIGSTLTNIAREKIGQSAGYYNSNQGPSVNRTGALKNISSAAMGPMAAALQKTVSATISNFLANSKDRAGNPATSLSVVVAPSQDVLLKQIQDMISNTIDPAASNFDYHTIDDTIKDPTEKSAATIAINTIEDSIEAIFASAQTGKDIPADVYTKLATAILNLQNIKNYNTSGDVGTASGAAPQITRISPELKKVANSVNMKPEELSKLAGLKNTGITSAELGRILGLQP